jgi:hypothetical protein
LEPGQLTFDLNQPPVQIVKAGHRPVFAGVEPNLNSLLRCCKTSVRSSLDYARNSFGDVSDCERVGRHARGRLVD